jgi:hypothetical protein
VCSVSARGRPLRFVRNSWQSSEHQLGCILFIPHRVARNRSLEAVQGSVLLRCAASRVAPRRPRATCKESPPCAAKRTQRAARWGRCRRATCPSGRPRQRALGGRCGGHRRRRCQVRLARGEQTKKGAGLKVADVVELGAYGTLRVMLRLGGTPGSGSGAPRGRTR